jgi:hypothetical protein
VCLCVPAVWYLPYVTDLVSRILMAMFFFDTTFTTYTNALHACIQPSYMIIIRTYLQQALITWPRCCPGVAVRVGGEPVRLAPCGGLDTVCRP